MKLEMIPDDIEGSKPGDATQCPIAQMLHRYFLLKDGFLFYVYPETIKVGRPPRSWKESFVPMCEIATNPDIKKFIKTIDAWGLREQQLTDAEEAGHAGILYDEHFNHEKGRFVDVPRRARHLKKPAPIVLELDIPEDCLKEALV